MNNTSDKVNALVTYNPYEIRVRGRISRHGAAWFEAMTVSVNTETTPPQTVILTGSIDQATLYGLISRIRDLGLTLISIKPLDDKNEKGE